MPEINNRLISLETQHQFIEEGQKQPLWEGSGPPEDSDVAELVILANQRNLRINWLPDEVIEDGIVYRTRAREAHKFGEVDSLIFTGPWIKRPFPRSNNH
jgi:hypothetical protein